MPQHDGADGFRTLALTHGQHVFRPFKNAKRMFSCCLICFALYKYQFPSVHAPHLKELSPLKMLVMRLSRKETILENTQDLANLHRQCPLQTFPRTHEASSSSLHGESESHDDTCPAMEEPWSRNSKAENHAFVSDGDVAKQSSTLHFASIFLLIKLFSKTATLLHLDKSHKKLRMVKLMKLAK
jgi:hypothetical protein